MSYIFFIIIALIIIFVAVYNMILSRENKLINSKASIDVILKKRFDLIPNLVSIVKEYSQYESNILKKIVGLRNKTNNVSNFEISNKLDLELEKIKLLVEKYPNLKSSKNFLELQEALRDLEDEISAARRTYNAHCTSYNTFIKIFPLNIVSYVFGFKEYPLFEISNEERKNQSWL